MRGIDRQRDREGGREDMNVNIYTYIYGETEDGVRINNVRGKKLTKKGNNGSYGRWEKRENEGT